MSDKNSLIIASTNHHIRIIRSADIKDSIDSIDLIVPFNLKEEIQGQPFDNLSNIFYIRANKIKSSGLANCMSFHQRIMIGLNLNCHYYLPLLLEHIWCLK